MVRAGPDVDENQRPEVQNRQFIRIHRAVCHFGQEVIHQPQKRRGQEKCHRIVTIPPLHERILHPGVDVVTFEQTHRHLVRIDDVQNGDRNERGDVKPDGDIQVALPAFDDRAEHVDPENHPDQRNGNVDRPFEFGVFVGSSQTQRQRNGRRYDDGLPAPEVDFTEQIAEHPGFAKPLQRVINTHKDGIADEGENDRVGVQRPNPSEGRILVAEVGRRSEQLAGNQHPDQHADDPPDDGGNGEIPDNAVVILEALHGGSGSVPRSGVFRRNRNRRFL